MAKRFRRQTFWSLSSNFTQVDDTLPAFPHLEPMVPLPDFPPDQVYSTQALTPIDQETLYLHNEGMKIRRIVGDFHPFFLQDGLANEEYIGLICELRVAFMMLPFTFDGQTNTWQPPIPGQDDFPCLFDAHDLGGEDIIQMRSYVLPATPQLANQYPQDAAAATVAAGYSLSGTPDDFVVFPTNLSPGDAHWDFTFRRPQREDRRLCFLAQVVPARTALPLEDPDLVCAGFFRVLSSNA